MITKNRLKSGLGLFCISTAFAFTIHDLSRDAYFPGGPEAMDEYFSDSLKYPVVELEAGNEEIIRVRFSVSEKGKAMNPTLTTLFGGTPAFEAEAKRLVNDMPLWTPATDKHANPIVSYLHTAYIKFVLPDSLCEKFPIEKDTAVVVNAEEMPQFRGGEENFQTYLMWFIRYPQLEREQGKDGTVYIYFEVAPCGKIEKVLCKKGVPGAPGLAKEGIRVISGMPRWIPGKVGGKAVRVGMTVPIRFRLQ
jgi:hypothetical protein